MHITGGVSVHRPTHHHWPRPANAAELHGHYGADSLGSLPLIRGRDDLAGTHPDHLMYFMFENVPHRPGNPIRVQHRLPGATGLFPLFCDVCDHGDHHATRKGFGNASILTTPGLICTCWLRDRARSPWRQATLACIVAFSGSLGFDTAVWVFAIAIVNAGSWVSGLRSIV